MVVVEANTVIMPVLVLYDTWYCVQAVQQTSDCTVQYQVQYWLTPFWTYRTVPYSSTVAVQYDDQSHKMLGTNRC